MQIKRNAVGRYAPSPTGDLHLGNLRTALLAWLFTRLQQGQFLLRLEDLDTPRVVDGSADRILEDLEWLGLDWDGHIVRQSARTEAYQAALSLLLEQGLVYPCFCSRKDIQSAPSAPHMKVGVYPGTCSELTIKEQQRRALHKNPAMRVRVPAGLDRDCGDFVIKRADNLFAYQLAVVVDDLAQGVTQVVRGADLADSTARQHYLAQRLTPRVAPIEYLHMPLRMDEDGKRMSKRDGSQSVKEWRHAGLNASDMVSLFAYELGLIDKNTPLSATELLATVNIEQIIHLDVT